MTQYIWQIEHDAILEHIASTDLPNSEWPLLRDIIKHKINKNIDLFLSGPGRPTPPAHFPPVATASGGLKLAPFPQRKSLVPAPVNYMTAEEAEGMKDSVFALLDQFDSNPPFTIQRVCELCLNPKQNYNSVGKYLRAVEKSLLVTSTYDSFPTINSQRARYDCSHPGRHRLHHAVCPSRSPPPSPLILANIGEAHPDPLETKALGLVDELDDPAPGHMSEHPVALTSVTTSDGEQVVDSLEARFVRAQGGGYVRR
ncbi:hypothetical protein MVEN_02066800 [Mycena venus]|uniref:PPP4R2-domain-containing protein n=1 Tax=Mycena venus TaxID=2733690 RepID=A0A8H7CI83_9AGAR|nr:hypothetical protein MVEN_02066800 [Mycena venus]